MYLAYIWVKRDAGALHVHIHVHIANCTRHT